MWIDDNFIAHDLRAQFVLHYWLLSIVLSDPETNQNTECWARRQWAVVMCPLCGSNATDTHHTHLLRVDSTHVSVGSVLQGMKDCLVGFVQPLILAVFVRHSYFRHLPFQARGPLETSKFQLASCTRCRNSTSLAIVIITKNHHKMVLFLCSKRLSDGPNTKVNTGVFAVADIDAAVIWLYRCACGWAGVCM